jgi:hypothetical protein
VDAVPSLASSAITIQGRAVFLPLEVRDAKSMFAAFLVPSLAARQLIPAPGIRVAEILPGRTIVSVAAIEHLDNDLGRYDEVAVSFPVTLGRRVRWPLVGVAADFASQRSAVYIRHMPVTTPFSCAAGREIWGLPKVVADVSYTDFPDRRSVRLTVNGRHALTLSVRRGGSWKFQDASFAAVAIRDGRAWKTPVTSSGEGVGVGLGGAELELGEHAIGAELAALGLPKRPIFSGWIERLRARFLGPTLLDA